MCVTVPQGQSFMRVTVVANWLAVQSGGALVNFSCWTGDPGGCFGRCTGGIQSSFCFRFPRGCVRHCGGADISNQPVSWVPQAGFLSSPQVAAQETPVPARFSGMFAGGKEDAEGAGPGNPGFPTGLRQPLPARAGGCGIWQEAEGLVSRSSC